MNEREQFKQWFNATYIDKNASQVDVAFEFFNRGKAARASQPAQEPVAWTLDFGNGINARTTFDTKQEAKQYALNCSIADVLVTNPKKPNVIPLYTTPPSEAARIAELEGKLAECISELKDVRDDVSNACDDAKNNLPYMPEKYIEYKDQLARIDALIADKG